MPPKKLYKSLARYRMRLSQRTIPVLCRHCIEPILAKNYEKHISQFHDFNPRLGCVWCEEKFWNRNEKHANADHLISCFVTFVYPPLLLTPPTSPRPHSENLILSTRPNPYLETDYFECPALPIHTQYELPFPRPVKPKPFFQDDDLNLAAAYALQYQEESNAFEYFHVVVKAVALKRFDEAMREDGGTTTTLLFASWCDGGEFENPMYRQHRHMIVVSPKGHFQKNVWNKVNIPEKDRPCPLYRCKGMERINSAMHLLNTFNYVTNRKSKCPFESKDTPTTKLHNFYLYKTLPVDFELPLALLWNGGLKELLYERKFQSVNLNRVIEKPVRIVEGQWRQKIKHFYGHERGLVVPVAKGLMPTWDAIPNPACTFHLLEGKKLYFHYSPENESMDEETWLRKQAEGGNCFYDAVKEEMWTPCPRDQKLLSMMIPQAERIRDLEYLKELKEREIREQLDQQREVMEREIRAELDEQREVMEREIREQLNELREAKEREIREKRAQLDELREKRAQLDELKE